MSIGCLNVRMRMCEGEGYFLGMTRWFFFGANGTKGCVGWLVGWWKESLKLHCNLQCICNDWLLIFHINQPNLLFISIYPNQSTLPYGWEKTDQCITSWFCILFSISIIHTDWLPQDTVVFCLAVSKFRPNSLKSNEILGITNCYYSRKMY